jgi:predicted RNase H-like nuclease (RuvC/YqgF family)
MSEQESKSDSIDHMSREILKAVFVENGRADTSKIKDVTGFEDNGSIHYRYDKLEGSELLERVDTETQTTTVQLTEDGEVFCEQNFTETVDEERLDARIDEVEEFAQNVLERNKELESEVQELKEENEKLRSEIGEITANFNPDAVDELQEDVGETVNGLRNMVKRQEAKVRLNMELLTGWMYGVTRKGFSVATELPADYTAKKLLRDYYEIDEDAKKVRLIPDRERQFSTSYTQKPWGDVNEEGVLTTQEMLERINDA